MILEAPTSHTIALIRLACFSIWLVVYSVAPLPRLASLPTELYQAPGALNAIPSFATRAILTPAGLWVVEALLLIGLAAVILGVRPHRLVAIPTVGLLMLADGIAKGYGGYVNHAQFVPLYCAVVLAVFPASDALSVCGRSTVKRDPRLWAFASFAVGLIVTLPFSFVGARRLAAGIDVFYGDHLIAWLATRSLAPGGYDFRMGLLVVEHPWLALSLKAGFVVVTAAEVLAPLALVSDRFRIAWVAMIVPFQVLTLFTMNIFFWENVVLVLALFTAFAYRIGAPAISPPRIIFYDGVCGLCNRFIRWVQHRDIEQVFRFAPLQGETAAARLGPQDSDGTHWSVVLLDGDGRHERSDATLRIVCALGGASGVVGSAMMYVPRPLRDAVYQFIASRRYDWFGRVDVCPLPSAEQRSVMLP